MPLWGKLLKEQIERVKANYLARQEIVSITTFLNVRTKNKQQQTFIAENYFYSDKSYNFASRGDMCSIFALSKTLTSNL